MKKISVIFLCCLLLTACGKQGGPDVTSSASKTTPTTASTENISIPAGESSAPTVPESIETTTSENASTVLLVYSPDDNLEGFLQTEVEIDALNEEAIISALINADVLTEDVKVNSTHLNGTELQIDLNSAFRDQILSLGSAGERAVMGSFVNTFLTAYPDANTLSITVDGEVLESGHVVYDFPLEFYR